VMVVAMVNSYEIESEGDEMEGEIKLKKFNKNRN